MGIVKHPYKFTNTPKKRDNSIEQTFKNTIQQRH